MIYVYGDDASDQRKERVISVGVIAGYEEWWQQVESDWAARCGGIPFHATDCESDAGDYETTSHDQNKAMYRDLVGILATSRLGGIGLAYDLLANKRVFPGNDLPIYFRAFVDSLDRAASLGENCGEIASITFDISLENEYNASQLYDYSRKVDDRLARWLAPEISFVPWRESARVQMADLLAYEAWKALDHTVGPIKRKRGSWDLLRSTGRFETLSYSEEWYLGLKAHITSGELEKKVGFNEMDYLNWLEKTGRTHNTSNLIHFLGTRP